MGYSRSVKIQNHNPIFLPISNRNNPDVQRGQQIIVQFSSPMDEADPHIRKREHPGLTGVQQSRSNKETSK